ncbi:hypothetical protein OIU78_028293 [Salix suchowensis]|nr:hypothetical protein OIU78_028293 [Salix suchowensis]KAJ6378033.1 hypothetical protein OIU78_028293 [Salix suchowensis]
MDPIKHRPSFTPKSIQFQIFHQNSQDLIWQIIIWIIICSTSRQLFIRRQGQDIQANGSQCWLLSPPQHSVAWDVGTGNGQAAISVAEVYEKVIATDISDEQLKQAIPHPQVKYVHTPLEMSDDELVSLIGGENSVDLITAATAVQWFDLDRFYPIVKRVLRKPGGIIAVWCYGSVEFSPEIDAILRRFFDLGKPFQSQSFKIASQCYKTLPFPFESVGVGCEGKPLELDMHKEMSFQGLLKFLSSLPVVHIAKEQGVDLLPEELLKDFERAWGEPESVRTATYKTYMLAGKVKL